MSTEDVGVVARLFLAEATFHQQIDGYFELDPAFDWQSYVHGLLGRADRHVGVVECGGEPVAFLYARFNTTLAAPTVRRTRWQRLLRRSPAARRTVTPLRPRAWGVIEQCWVEEAFRRQGLAGRLLEDALAWLRERGASRVELGVSAQNPAAQELWGSYGFERFRFSMSLDLEGERDP